MLDIGGTVGAGVVYVDPGLSGTEIEIRRPPAAGDRRHTRPAGGSYPGGGAMCAAVFESLAEGIYELRLRPPVRGGVVVALEIRGRGGHRESVLAASAEPVLYPDTTNHIHT